MDLSWDILTNDYTPIDITNATAFANKAYEASGFENTGNELFNGNISYTTLALSKINTGATAGYSYGYDQLNRLVEMRQHIDGIPHPAGTIAILLPPTGKALPTMPMAIS